MISSNISALIIKSKGIAVLALDLIVVTIILLIPSLSHLTAIPVYILEPMRFAVIFCVIYTNRTNSLIIAFLLPAVSFLISAHPEVAKGILISLELLVNVILFYYLHARMNNNFFIMLLSILIAKVFYYSAKFLLISFGILSESLFSTPFWIQYLIMLLISIYAAVSLNNEKYVPSGNYSI